jgi:RHS repeat-associated protein
VTNNSTTTTTIYLGQAEEIATTGSTTNVTKYYYAGDRRVAERVGNAAITYLVADGLSSVTQALDSAGNVVATQLFGPYGNTRYQQGTMPTTFGFTGQRQDTSGLDLFGARFYDPAIGQFVSADETIPGSGAILGALNRFAYVLGNPETATDPSGHWGFGNIVKAVTNVVKAAAPAIAHAVQVAAPVVAAVADSALGISSIVNDAKTIFDPHASWSSRLLSVADLAINVAMDVDTITGTGQAARAAYMGVKAGAKLAGKQAVKLMKGEAKHLAEKEIENVGKKRGEGMVEKVFKSCMNSFAGDTQVATAEGSQPIATLKVGDKVLAVDGATGKVQAELVQNVMINHDNNLLDVTLATDTNVKPSAATDAPNKEQEVATAAHGSQAPPTETIHTTTEHPFLTAELGWVNAQDLKPGEHVRRMDGSLGIVVAVKATPGQAVRYNLTVVQDHTFVVGQGQWVVHNNECMGTRNIGFTQDTVSGSGRLPNGKGYSVKGNAKWLHDNPGKDLPAIRVFQKTAASDAIEGVGRYGPYSGRNLLNGAWYTLDNRRLMAYQLAGRSSIPVKIVSEGSAWREAWKFTTNTWGLIARIK